MRVNQLTRSRQTALIWLTIILLILGIFFRFGNIDRKIHSPEETITYLRISGYNELEFVEHILSGKVINSQELFKYQRINAEKGWQDSIKEIANHPDKAPLYYLMARLWTQIFGSSLAALRFFSALIAILAFPAVYLLCRELFGLPLTRWTAIATISISPFHVLFAGEGQPLTLVTTTILLSSAALLRAMRVNTISSWLIYSALVAVGFYSHWFFSCVAIAHLIYVLFAERMRPNRIVLSFLISFAIASITAIPLIANINLTIPLFYRDISQIWRQTPSLETIESWVLDLTRPFFDLDRGWCIPTQDPGCQTLLNYEQSLLYILAIPLLFLVIYSIYFLFKNAPRRVGLFILVLIGGIFIDLVLPDVSRVGTGGDYETVHRYVLPYLIGVELAVAYCISNKIADTYDRFWQHKFWQSVLLIVISLGVISSGLSLQAYSWWNKASNYSIQPIAEIINKSSTKPLLFYFLPDPVLKSAENAEKALIEIVPLSNSLEPKVGMMFLAGANKIENIPDTYDTIFLYQPAPELRDWLEKEENQLELVYSSVEKEPLLWQLRQK